MPSTDVSWDEQTSADAGRLWAGGAVTALVAAGVALIGVMLMYKVLHVHILTPGGDKEPTASAKLTFPLAAALVTLVATGLLHVLMATTPRAPQFFGWIAGLGIALLVLQVFVGGSTDLLPRFGTAVFYLVVGVAITSSLYGVGRTAVRYHRHQDYRERAPRGPAVGYPEPGYRDQGYRDAGYRAPAYPEPGYREAGYADTGYPAPDPAYRETRIDQAGHRRDPRRYN